MRFAEWFQESSDDLTQIHLPNSGNGSGEVHIGNHSSVSKTNTPMDSFRLFYHHNWGDWDQVLRASQNDANIANLLKQIEVEQNQKNYVDKDSASRAASLHQLVSAVIKTHGRGSQKDKFDSDLFGSQEDGNSGSWIDYQGNKHANGNGQPTRQSPDPGSTTKLAADKTIAAIWEKFREYEKRLTDIESKLSRTA